MVIDTLVFLNYDSIVLYYFPIEIRISSVFQMPAALRWGAAYAAADLSPTGQAFHTNFNLTPYKRFREYPAKICRGFAVCNCGFLRRYTFKVKLVLLPLQVKGRIEPL
ncbi:MAG: hypothetical protein P4L75_05935 [Clostridia bacterium]|nr:hypothetical protein [Clostridia bacterium]